MYNIRYMKKILEAKISQHNDHTPHGIKKCEGSGKWSSKDIHHVLRTGTNELCSDWSAECPLCRNRVKAVDVRSRLMVKETISEITNKIKDIIRRDDFNV